MYHRIIESSIKSSCFQGKVLMIIGPRQIGKTTLIENILTQYPNYKIKTFNGDNESDKDILKYNDIYHLEKFVSNFDIIFIDEGQKIPNIGNTLKILIDKYKQNKQIIVTGSSAFNLLNNTSESLIGRKIVYNLFPISLQEIYQDSLDLSNVYNILPTLLIFGSYPEVLTKNNNDDKIKLLHDLTSSKLYIDIFEFQQIKNPEILRNLLKALALQIGNQVSLSELANLLGIDKKTIERYIDLLEKNLIIFRLNPYTNKKRQEISKQKKIYFYDLGIRNTLINNFNYLDLRTDTGALFENLMIIERMKYRSYNNIYANQYFWRNNNGSEVDFIEEINGELYSYEFKWNPNKIKQTPPPSWQTYTNNYQVITKNNWEKLVIYTQPLIKS